MMFGGGRGVGGGGGSMLKVVVGRSVTRAGVTNLQEALSSSTGSSGTGSGTATSPTAVSKSTHRLNNSLTLSSDSSGSSSYFNTLISANNDNIFSGNCVSSWPSGDEYEWVSVDGNASEEEKSIADDFVLGPVPSVDEVHSAVSALTQAFEADSYSQLVTDKFAYNANRDVSEISNPTDMLRRVSPVGLEPDWMEPSPYLCNSRTLRPYSPDRVYDVVHLLQHDPSVQRMVISLSSDIAVWNAVMNNDVVRELRETYYAEEKNTCQSPDGCSEETIHDTNPTTDAVKWIFQSTKAKFMEVLEKITTLMNELFKAPVVDDKATGTTDFFEERLRTSFLLSVVVLLVVVVSRAHRA